MTTGLFNVFFLASLTRSTFATGTEVCTGLKAGETCPESVPDLGRGHELEDEAEAMATTLMQHKLSAFDDGDEKGAYRGCQSVTKSGHTCQAWTSNSPHEPSDMNAANIKARKNGLGDHNFCRDAEGSGNIWCYTTSSDTRWEYCNTCNEANAGNGSYRGCQTRTKSGLVCQPWTALAPHTPSNKYADNIGAGKNGLGDHNYCRDAGGSGNIWCYTNDPDVRWEYCEPRDETAVCELIITTGRRPSGKVLRAINKMANAIGIDLKKIKDPAIEWSKSKFGEILRDQVAAHFGVEIDLDGEWKKEIIEGVVRDQINSLPFAMLIPDEAKEAIYEKAGEFIGGFVHKFSKKVNNVGGKVLDKVTDVAEDLHDKVKWVGGKIKSWFGFR